MYDDQGKIVKVEEIYLGEDILSLMSDNWSKFLYHFSYNSENELEELITTSTHSGSAFTISNRVVYEKDATENRSTKKEYRKNDGSDIWILVYQQDDFLNDNGCLIKATSANFHEDGTRYNYQWTPNDLY